MILIVVILSLDLVNFPGDFFLFLQFILASSVLIIKDKASF